MLCISTNFIVLIMHIQLSKIGADEESKVEIIRAEEMKKNLIIFVIFAWNSINLIKWWVWS